MQDARHKNSIILLAKGAVAPATVGEEVGEGRGVDVGGRTGIGFGVREAVGIGVSLGIRVGIGVGIAVSFGVSVEVGVAVGIDVGVRRGEEVGGRVGIGRDEVGDGVGGGLVAVPVHTPVCVVVDTIVGVVPPLAISVL